jgi:cytochrome b6-f complex iron-sulfur subunit
MTAPAVTPFLCGRRQILLGAGVGGAVVLATGCGSSKAASAPAPTAATTTTAAAPAASASAPASPSAAASTPKTVVKGLIALKDVPTGSAVAVNDSTGRHLLMSRNGESVVALDAKCTHMGCTVAPKNAELVCPCHSSHFSLTGQVTSGVAPSALATVAVRVTDGQVLLA